MTRGERLACFLFIQSMAGDTSQRRLRYDIDIALRRLRQLHGETVPTVQLTGVCHQCNG